MITTASTNAATTTTATVAATAGTATAAAAATATITCAGRSAFIFYRAIFECFVK